MVANERGNVAPPYKGVPRMPRATTLLVDKGGWSIMPFRFLRTERRPKRTGVLNIDVENPPRCYNVAVEGGIAALIGGRRQ
jgi:hypothetical protein